MRSNFFPKGFLGAIAALGIVNVANAAAFNPILGNGYNSDRTMPTNQSCFSGEILEQGPETGFLSFDARIDVNRPGFRGGCLV